MDESFGSPNWRTFFDSAEAKYYGSEVASQSSLIAKRIGWVLGFSIEILEILRYFPPFLYPFAFKKYGV